MELSVVNNKGKDTGRKVVLSDNIFAAEINDHAIYLDVKQFLANQRQGTHKAKERAEVAFSTKKLKKQKGTGGARSGSRKSPVFVGGGTIFGPRPRDYRFKLNKKLKTLARRSALTYKAKSNNISVLENLSFDKPKTKVYIDLLKNLSLSDKKTLLVLGDSNKNVFLSSRNLRNAKVITFDQLKTFDVLKADKVVLAEGSVAKLEELLG
ncbi:50S ribosomal protein L4 [Sporocytophaga myxococcoides]|uniref:Large ribosomal subunit protein uL4 n=1 Tax=Sporocytophaga myxococcoides TaxID=153721 RepID=A0A098LAW7_9BACT|nr:50S ribosomal protein L4 [Sporocytophaga myxococcoides]GAL84101.1 50S ribosomal protein L4 [Sporocytophaga myxococcoides]